MTWNLKLCMCAEQEVLQREREQLQNTQDKATDSQASLSPPRMKQLIYPFSKFSNLRQQFHNHFKLAGAS